MFNFMKKFLKNKISNKEVEEYGLFSKGGCYIFHINGKDVPGIILKNTKDTLTFGAIYSKNVNSTPITYRDTIYHCDKWSCTILPPNNEIAMKLAKTFKLKELVTSI